MNRVQRIVDYLSASTPEAVSEKDLRIAQLEDALRLLLKPGTPENRIRARIHAMRVLKGR